MELGARPEKAEEVERDRCCGVCVCKERSLSPFERVLVDEENVTRVSGSWAAVV